MQEVSSTPNVFDLLIAASLAPKTPENTQEFQRLILIASAVLEAKKDHPGYLVQSDHCCAQLNGALAIWNFRM